MSILNAGVNPSGSAITKDGRYLIVANNNNYGLVGEDTVSIFDLKHQRHNKLLTHPSFSEPYTVTIDEQRGVAYITNSASPSKVGQKGSITVISLKNEHEVIDVIEDIRLDGPSGMAIINDYAYVNNYGAAGGVGSGNGKSISIINLNKRSVVGTISVPLAPATLISKGKQLIVASYTTGLPDTGVISVIKVNGTNFNLVKQIDGLFGPFAIAASKDCQYLYVTNFGSNHRLPVLFYNASNNFSPFGRSLAIIDRTGKSSTVDIGIQPSGLAITPDGKYVIVTSYNTLYSDPVNYKGLTPGQGSLVYVNTKHHRVVKTIKTSRSPSNITISPDGQYSYVSCYSDNVINVIDNFETIIK